MDFYKIVKGKDKRYKKDGVDAPETIFPTFLNHETKDLMIRGRSFYAIWDEERQMWSTKESDVQRLVDKDLYKYAKDYPEASVRYMKESMYHAWSDYKSYLGNMFDTYHELDSTLTFSNTQYVKENYISKKLPYALVEGDISAYDELMSTLYDPLERQKLEWAIGAIVAGDAKDIQKFIVIYGEAGTGKSTFLNIVERLFEGYYVTFEAKALTSASNTFSMEQFRLNPLVAIQHDGDLSKIEDNTKLNSIIAHESMTMNEKYKSAYTTRLNAFLFMGTNKPVKITDSKSGIIRRLIDVFPSKRIVPVDRYYLLLDKINFELGGIAWHCLEVYRSLGKNMYSGHIPIQMMFETDVFFNFMEAYYFQFKKNDGTTLQEAYKDYKNYCDETLVEYKLPRHKFREELKQYFTSFSDRQRVDDSYPRNVFSGFKTSKFESIKENLERKINSLVIDSDISLLNRVLADCPAQLATSKGTPTSNWDDITTTLKDIDTRDTHFVRPPLNHIVTDFDIRGADGKKSLELNLEAASKWPVTYAEYSKSGAGIHLHYIYDGDVTKLSRVYSEGIEIKVFTGKSSLRRKFTKSNNAPIATINSGLPLKGEKMINFDAVKDEQHIRNIIKKALSKETAHAGTKPNIDLIAQTLEDAYKSGVKYDITDMRPKILAFANNSTNQADYCIKLVQKMKFASEEPSVAVDEYSNDEIIFFDVEVFPNLFVVCWKAETKEPVRMINPTPEEVEGLLKLKLVGFNNRRYDNHILYARYIGYDNLQLYQLSQKIINDSRNGLFGEAYNLSYADVYDFSSIKQSLKKFQIELGIHHQELGLKWDEEAPEELWDKVAEYCINDVISLQEVFAARKQDFIARQILADLSGLTVNDTTQTHAAKIIFGDDKKPQEKFVYTDLSKEFPGYSFDGGVSIYRGEEVGEGGWVYGEPGMYSEIGVYDISSQHPHSIKRLNLFGPYTQKFNELLDARIAIKHKEYEKAGEMLGGALKPYLERLEDSDDLAHALKLVLNSVYGYTSAKFDNKFRDPRNKDNIVAKRGALFMIDLKNAVQEKGYTVVHIKTDSIKVLDPTPEIVKFIFELGEQYGYTFEHEATFDRFCLLNNAVYIARYKDGKNAGKWTATGTQTSHPYVFKTLFKDGFIMSKTPCSGSIDLMDLSETKTVTTALYLDMNEGLAEDEHDYHFIGKAGLFCPILPGHGGGILLREKDDKFSAATGSKGYRWLETEIVQSMGKEDDIDLSYFNALVDELVDDISKYGDFEEFLSDVPKLEEENPIGFNDIPNESPF